MLYDVDKQKIWSSLIAKVCKPVTTLYLVDKSDHEGHQPQHKNRPFMDIFSRGNDRKRAKQASSKKNYNMSGKFVSFSFT